MSLSSPPPARAPGQTSLSRQVKLARFWMPVAIIGVVLLHQLLIVPLGGAGWQFWAQVLFYSILGPTVTFATLNWIAAEVEAREEAQDELRRLYAKLQKSHALLGAIQKVTEQFATAVDLEAALSAASQGIAEVTGARGTAVLLGPSGLGVTRSHGLSASMMRDALGRDRAITEKRTLPEPCEDEPCWVLSAALEWGGEYQGSVHAYFAESPSSEQRESFSILSAEFSAAAEATRSRTRDLLTLVDVDRSIRAEGNLGKLLETLLTQIMLRAEATLGGVYLADESGLLQLRAWRGLSNVSTAPAQTSLRVGEGFVGGAAQRAEPCIAGRLSHCAEDGPVLAGAGSAVSLPLSTDDELLGVVVLAHEREEHFDEANLPFLSLLAGQVSLAVRNARAYLQSEELAIAEERARIAREIHDGVAQSLAFAALKLDLVLRLENHPDKARRELEGAKRTIRETIKEVRRSIFALRPIDLERHGFAETIRRYVSDYGQQNDVLVGLEVQDTPQLTLKSEAVLFRIFQEAMNNVAKHASARRVDVTVGKTSQGCTFITVADDGQGFDPTTVSDRITSAGGLGLKQMRERVEGRGGTFELTAQPGGGTRVYASVPE